MGINGSSFARGTPKRSRQTQKRPRQLLALWSTRSSDQRMLLVPDSTRDRAAIGTLEGSNGHRNRTSDRPGERETKARKRARHTPRRQAAKSVGGRRNDHRPTYLGIRLGFLRDPSQVPRGVIDLVCGTKRREPEEKGPSPPTRKPRNMRPVISMILQGKKVKALLDTGCSVALINQRTVGELGITKKAHQRVRPIENFTGEIVQGAGQYYTEPLLLQHRRHFSKEKFEIAPMEEEIDVFLPFSWIEQHPPQGAWASDKEVRFNTARCVEECTRFTVNSFSLT